MKGSRLSAASVLAVAGILFGAGAVGFLVHRLLTPAPTLRLAPGQPAAPPATPSARTVPASLPDFILPDLMGQPRHLRDFSGRPLLVNFWATWCEPCRREIPLLQALRRENSRNQFEIVGIAIDNKDSVQQFVHDLGIDYPVLVGEKGGLEAVSAFGMETVLPFTVFADGEGRIVTLRTGELHRDEASFILARLSDLQTGRLGLQAAREQIESELGRLAVSRARGATSN